jgi:hypothetical protein
MPLASVRICPRLGFVETTIVAVGAAVAPEFGITAVASAAGGVSDGSGESVSVGAGVAAGAHAAMTRVAIAAIAIHDSRVFL